MDKSYERYYSSEVWEQKYRDEHYDLSSPKEDARYGALLQILRRYDKGPMLDLGCGDGLLWKAYRPLSDSLLVGVDYSAAAIAAANQRKLPNSRFECADYGTYVPAEEIAVVVFNESLYYIDDFVGAIQNANRRLSDSGFMVVSMFDTLVTRRIWKDLLRYYKLVQSATVLDQATGCKWTIRVFPKQQ